MNAETYAQDIDDVRHGGYVLYDSSGRSTPTLMRDGRHLPRRPARQAVRRELQGAARADPDEEHRLRRRRSSALLGIDIGRRRRAARARSSRATKRCASRTSKALRLGYDYAMENFACPLPFHLEKMDANGRRHPDRRQHRDRARLPLRRRDRGGAGTRSRRRPRSWTPSTRSARGTVARRSTSDDPTCRRTQNNYCILQAEDELAAIGMVIGAVVERRARLHLDVRARASR